MTGPARLDQALIRVSGPDAVTFLDNLLTQNVPRLAQARMLYGALLSPQGKVITDMTLWDDGGAIILETHASRAPDLLRRLTMYKLRSQVTLEDITASHEVLWSDVAFENAAPDSRLPALGWRALAARSETAHGDDAYDAHRLAFGAPDLARDAGIEEVFAGEALLEEFNGVDFQKGCFVGQENVSRMKRRATTRRKFCPVVFEGPPPAPGAPVTAGAAELGQIRTGRDGRAIALLRLDRALKAQHDGVEITAEGREMRLDPPSWLILPPHEGHASGAPD
jgi:tRNA-modifying protein YgfZ